MQALYSAYLNACQQEWVPAKPQYRAARNDDPGLPGAYKIDRDQDRPLGPGAGEHVHLTVCCLYVRQQDPVRAVSCARKVCGSVWPRFSIVGSYGTRRLGLGAYPFDNGRLEGKRKWQSAKCRSSLQG